MTVGVGYSAAEARRIKDVLDRDMAAIETRTLRMLHRVSDYHGYGWGESELESLRERVAELKAIVDRRTA